MSFFQTTVKQKKVSIFIETHIKIYCDKLYIQRLDFFAKKEIKIAKICITYCCSHNYGAKVNIILRNQTVLLFFFDFNKSFKELTQKPTIH